MHPSQGIRSAQMPMTYQYSNPMSMSPQYSYVSSPLTNFRSLPLSPQLSPTSLSNLQQYSQQASNQISAPSLTQVFVSVRGLPSTATKADLIALFEPFGPVSHISVSGSQALIGTTAEAVNTMMCYFAASPPRIHNSFLTLHLVKQGQPPTSFSSFSVPNSPNSFRRGLSPQVSPRQYSTTLAQNQQVAFTSLPSPTSMQANYSASALQTANLSLTGLNSNLIPTQSFSPVSSFLPMNMYDPNLNLNAGSYNPSISNPANNMSVMNSQPLNGNSMQMNNSYYSPGFAYPTTSVVLVSNLPTTTIPASNSSESSNEYNTNAGDRGEKNPNESADQITCLFTCDELFTLFGIYGDVLRVKILYHHPSSALIQLANPLHAEMCCQYLNHIVLYGRSISVTPSKYSEVEVPKGEMEIMGRFDHNPLTKEYLKSPAHRFRSTKNTNTNSYLRNLHPLSTVLHVSSIASTVTEAELKEMFAIDIDQDDVTVQFIDHAQHPSPLVASYHENDQGSRYKDASPILSKARSSSLSAPGAPDLNDLSVESQTNINSPALSSCSQSDSPTSISTTPSQSPRSTSSQYPASQVQQKQAFIRLPTLQAAVLALIHNHNKLVEGRYMRVSFARKEPNAIPGTPERTRRASLPGNTYNVSSAQPQPPQHRSNKSNSWGSSPIRSTSGSASVTSSPGWSSRSTLSSNTNSNASTAAAAPNRSRLRPWNKTDVLDSYDPKTKAFSNESSDNNNNSLVENTKNEFESQLTLNSPQSMPESEVAKNSKVLEAFTKLHDSTTNVQDQNEVATEQINA